MTTPQPMADADAIDAFLIHLQAARGRSARTAEAYRMALQRLREFLAGKPLLQADATELETFAGVWLHKRGVVAVSRKPYVAALRGFYGWARLRGLVAASPADQLQHPKIGRPLPAVLSLASAEKLMWAPDLNTFRGIRDAAMLSLLVGCGVRVSGLVGMHQEDLREEEIDKKPRLVVRVVEKGGRERELPLPREAEMLVRVYLEHDELKPLDRNVTTHDGRPARVLWVNLKDGHTPPHERRGEVLRISRGSVWRMIQAYGERAGVPPEQRHPHAFRHLFGTELAEDDVDLVVRQKMLGHVDPKSTQIYSELALRKKTRVMDANAPLSKIKTPVSELLRRL